MALHIIIDGYNLILTSGLVGSMAPGDLPEGREALIDLLCAYKKKKAHKITVVFDAQYVETFTARSETYKGIRMVFSRPGQLADDVIKNMAQNYKEAALIVSSDHDVAGFCQMAGCAVVSCHEFSHRVMDSLYSFMDEEPEQSNIRRSDTRKKGPSRRLPKNKRRSRKKALKL